MTLFDFVGFLGVFCYLGGYFLLSLKKIDGNGYSYLVINLFGALFVAISLIESFNAPSFTIQISWIILSIYGLIHLKRTSSVEYKSSRDYDMKEYLRLKKKLNIRD
jgi:hypothetical protein